MRHCILHAEKKKTSDLVFLDSFRVTDDTLSLATHSPRWYPSMNTLPVGEGGQQKSRKVPKLAFVLFRLNYHCTRKGSASRERVILLSFHSFISTLLYQMLGDSAVPPFFLIRGGREHRDLLPPGRLVLPSSCARRAHPLRDLPQGAVALVRQVRSLGGLVDRRTVLAAPVDSVHVVFAFLPGDDPFLEVVSLPHLPRFLNHHSRAEALVQQTCFLICVPIEPWSKLREVVRFYCPWPQKSR